MRLARGMGIPADDAARLAMNIVIEQRRVKHPEQAALDEPNPVEARVTPSRRR